MCISSKALLYFVGFIMFATTATNQGIPKEVDNKTSLEKIRGFSMYSEIPHLINSAVCKLCEIAMDFVIWLSRMESGRNVVDIVSLKICFWLRLFPENICSNIVAMHRGPVFYVLAQKRNMTGSRICSILLQQFQCRNPDRQDWEINIPPPKTTPGSEKPVDVGTRPIKILHLTDVHYDPEYVVGSNADCSSLICCTPGSKPSVAEDSAGFWGDYRNCDVPWHTFTNILEHINAEHKDLNYIYFTGDIISHKQWKTSVDSNVKVFKKVMQEFKRVFKNVPVYPILGNHESHPLNQFFGKNVTNANLSIQWLFDLAAEEWSEWLPLEASQTIKHGGFYTALVKPGFRIVGLNSNVCYILNWWLFYDDYDTYAQLNWLVEVLLLAEDNNEIVHILSHIPNGSNVCFHNWSREYARIINRFSHIIAAQFTGHTHFNQINLFFNTSSPSQAINVAFSAGSLTTFSGVNPSYNIYKISSKNKEVLDYESWTFNLTEANHNYQRSPKWYRLFSFTKTFQVPNLKPQTLSELAFLMANNSSFLDLYSRLSYSNADSKIANDCNHSCKMDLLCDMVTHQMQDQENCNFLKYIYYNTLNNNKMIL